MVSKGILWQENSQLNIRYLGLTLLNALTLLCMLPLGDIRGNIVKLVQGNQHYRSAATYLAIRMCVCWSTMTGSTSGRTVAGKRKVLGGHCGGL